MVFTKEKKRKEKRKRKICISRTSPVDEGSSSTPSPWSTRPLLKSTTTLWSPRVIHCSPFWIPTFTLPCLKFLVEVPPSSNRSTKVKVQFCPLFLSDPVTSPLSLSERSVEFRTRLRRGGGNSWSGPVIGQGWCSWSVSGETGVLRHIPETSVHIGYLGKFK